MTYSIMLYSSNWALSLLTVPMVSVLKNLGPIAITLSESVADNKALSSGVLLSMLILFFGRSALAPPWPLGPRSSAAPRAHNPRAPGLTAPPCPSSPKPASSASCTILLHVNPGRWPRAASRPHVNPGLHLRAPPPRVHLHYI